MTVPPLLRAAAPVGLALAGVAVTLAVSSRALPERVTMVHLQDGGGTAFAASRDDLLLVGGLVVVLVVLAYLVSAAALAWTPVRHLLVPHPEFWKQTGHRRELRLRLARWLAVGVAVALWSLAALYVLTMLAQGDGPLSAWWIPAALSGVVVLVQLVGLAWVVAAGFRPETARPASSRPAADRAATPGRARADAAGPPARTPATRTPPARTPPARTAPGAAAPRSGTAGAGSARTGTGTGTARSGTARPGAARTGTARPGAADPTDEKKGPPRPYQPRPRQGGGPRG
ncbi:hypothetical protein [Frigoribacterium sp. PhB160]|uniref:hypothetical protein n=1 Tax=Frigoribacterium sp. PhB160 TaxID=2485192 RepID=UPI0011CE7886|nr:hypothetical protein [Frigoribacterium sp. PhB160]